MKKKIRKVFLNLFIAYSSSSILYSFKEDNSRLKSNKNFCRNNMNAFIRVFLKNLFNENMPNVEFNI